MEQVGCRHTDCAGKREHEDEARFDAQPPDSHALSAERHKRQMNQVETVGKRPERNGRTRLEQTAKESA
jgi:hypothetical protein